jgi:hypothetical protein
LDEIWAETNVGYVQVCVQFPQKRTMVANGGLFKKCTFQMRKAVGMYARTKFCNEIKRHGLSAVNPGCEGSAVKP